MSWGGRRDGAGRKTGSGKFGERTAPVRVPERLANDIDQVIATYDEHQQLLKQLQELLQKWDEKTVYPVSVKNSNKKLARELWNELKSLLDK